MRNKYARMDIYREAFQIYVEENGEDKRVLDFLHSCARKGLITKKTVWRMIDDIRDDYYEVGHLWEC